MELKNPEAQLENSKESSRRQNIKGLKDRRDQIVKEYEKTIKTKQNLLKATKEKKISHIYRKIQQNNSLFLSGNFESQKSLEQCIPISNTSIKPICHD